MWHHADITAAALKQLLVENEIQFGGHVKLKIYGKLSCPSGKRMQKENRVFFSSEKEALSNGYRPCGHCLRKKYKQWIAQGSG